MTLPNLTQYTAPGVYWTNSPAPTSAVAGLSTSVVAIVGPGIGYRVHTDSVTLTSSGSVTLSQLGINQASIVVTSLSGTTTYSSSTDYVINQTAATDGYTQDTVTTIQLATGSPGSTIPSGTTVVVSYQFTNYLYGTPSTVNDFNTVKSLYGNPFNSSTGAITSPLSFAAQIAFDNGASTLVLIDPGVVSPPGFTTSVALLDAAYAQLSPIDQIDLVVPLPIGITDSTNVTNVSVHLSTWLSNEAKVNDNLRMGVAGYESAATITPDVVAQATLYKRVVQVWPNSISYYNGYTNTTQTLPGYYLAVAYAGILSGNPPQQGLTRQRVSDFSGIAPAVFSTASTSYKNQLASSGVSVLEISPSGNLWVRHGVTTDNTSVYNQEISLVRAQDAIIKLLEETFADAAIIGTPITPTMVATVSGLVTGALANAVQLGLCDSASNVQVSQNPLYPTVFNVTFTYVPAYPLNVIEISFSIDTTNGTISTSSSTAGGQ